MNNERLLSELNAAKAKIEKMQEVIVKCVSANMEASVDYAHTIEDMGKRLHDAENENKTLTKKCKNLEEENSQLRTKLELIANEIFSTIDWDAKDELATVDYPYTGKNDIVL